MPDFRAMLEKAKADAVARPELQVVHGGQSDSRAPRRRLVWIGGWATAAVAATLAGVLLTGDRSDADMEFERLVAAYSADVSSGALRSPTSGLLNVLGMNLTRSVPLIGASIRSLDPGQLPNVPDPGGRDG
jgi:hypothetical protein